MWVGGGLCDQTTANSVIDCETRQDVDFRVDQFNDEIIAGLVEEIREFFGILKADGFDSCEFRTEGFDGGGHIFVGFDLVSLAATRETSHISPRLATIIFTFFKILGFMRVCGDFSVVTLVTAVTSGVPM